MKQGLKMLGISLGIAGIMAAALAGTAFAAGGEQGAGWGQSSDGAGPGLENQWGKGAGGQGCGEASDGDGPNLYNQWGQIEE